MTALAVQDVIDPLLLDARARELYEARYGYLPRRVPMWTQLPAGHPLRVQFLNVAGTVGVGPMTQAELRAVARGIGQRVVRRSAPKMIKMHTAVERVARRFESIQANAWMRAVNQFQKRVNMQQLEAAIATGRFAGIEAVVDASAFEKAVEKAMRDPIKAAAQQGGVVASKELQRAGLALSFNAIHPNIINYAHTQAARLVVNASEEVRGVIRTIVGLGAQGVLTVAQQARLIRGVVGLPPNWLNAPLALGDELRMGSLAAVGRRFSAVERQQIRSRIAAGTSGDPAFVAQMQDAYSARLIAARAMAIARTESLAAANWGVNEAWKQYQAKKLIPKTARRFWLIAPDSRLCRICAQVPGLNPTGVPLDQPFVTPLGPKMLPPAHVQCRCGMGLMFRPGATTAPTEREVALPTPGAEGPLPPLRTPLREVPAHEFDIAVRGTIPMNAGASTRAMLEHAELVLDGQVADAGTSKFYHVSNKTMTMWKQRLEANGVRASIEQVKGIIWRGTWGEGAGTIVPPGPVLPGPTPLPPRPSVVRRMPVAKDLYTELKGVQTRYQTVAARAKKIAEEWSAQAKAGWDEIARIGREAPEAQAVMDRIYRAQDLGIKASRRQYAIEKAMRRKMQERVFLPPEFRSTAVIELPSKRALKANESIQRGVDGFKAMVHKDYFSVKPTWTYGPPGVVRPDITLKMTKASRVFARPPLREAYANKYSAASTVVHELTHNLEYYHTEVWKSANAFRAARTAGEPMRPMAKLAPRMGYRRDEIGKADRFIDPYVGKFYNDQRTTEVITMGMQEMFADPVAFYERDPEHFQLILRVMWHELPPEGLPAAVSAIETPIQAVARESARAVEARIAIRREVEDMTHQARLRMRSAGDIRDYRGSGEIRGTMRSRLWAEEMRRAGWEVNMEHSYSSIYWVEYSLPRSAAVAEEVPLAARRAAAVAKLDTLKKVADTRLDGLVVNPIPHAAQARMDAMMAEIRAHAREVMARPGMPVVIWGHPESLTPLQDVTVAEIRSLQRAVSRDNVQRLIEEANWAEVPAVHMVRYKGKLYLWDGNHRTTAARLLGHEKIRAEVFDLDHYLATTATQAAQASVPFNEAQQLPGPLHLPVWPGSVPPHVPEGA